MDRARANALVTRTWDESIVPALVEYIRIPNQSPAFDAEWEAHGHMEKAVQLVAAWCRSQPLPGMKLEVVRLPGRTPVLFMDIPGSRPGTVLLYGHLDKQPEMVGWAEGLGPWVPARKGDRLFGRGVGDDDRPGVRAVPDRLGGCDDRPEPGLVRRNLGPRFSRERGLAGGARLRALPLRCRHRQRGNLQRARRRHRGPAAARSRRIRARDPGATAMAGSFFTPGLRMSGRVRRCGWCA